MVTTLFDLTGARAELFEALLRVQEEPDPSDYDGDEEECDAQAARDKAARERALEEALNEIDYAVEAKADDIGEVLLALRSEADAARQQERRWTAKRRARENASARLKAYVLDCMASAGFEKISGEKYTLARQASHPGCEVLDALSAVQAGYGEMVPNVDRKAIIAAWKATPEAIAEFARVTQDRFLRVR